MTAQERGLWTRLLAIVLCFGAATALLARNARSENVPPRCGPATGNANRADGSATMRPSSSRVAPMNQTTVFAREVRTAPPIQS